MGVDLLIVRISIVLSRQIRGELIGMEFIHAEELDRDVTEGAGHTGVGAVVQIIARKPD